MYKDIKAAVNAITATCDWASTIDGVGFNGADARFGHLLTGTPVTAWTPKMAFRAWLMLRKYRKQLLDHHNIDYDKLTVPEIPEGSTSKTIRIDSGKYALTFPYDVETKDLIKEGKGARWNRELRQWELPINTENIPVLLNLLFDRGFYIDGTAMDTLIRSYERVQEMIAASTAKSSDFELKPGFGFELMPFQRAGVEYAVKTKRCLIADTMGLGKTIEALAFIHQLSGYPALIICPASLKLNWKRETEKALPGKTVSVWSTKKLKTRETCPKTDIVIINYDIIHKKEEELRALHPMCVVLDESHYIKNSKARRTKAVKSLLNGIPYRLALTGTPVLNRPIELVPQLQALDRLNDFGGWKHFTDRYCTIPMPERMREAIRKQNLRKAIDTPPPTMMYTGAKNLSELNDKLRATCYIRRKKEDVLTELPEKRRSVIPIELDEKKYADIETATALRLFEIEEEEVDEKVKNPQLARFSMQLTEIEELKQQTVELKLPFIYEWIESVLENEEKLLIFVWHRAAGNAISERFNVPYINGDTPVNKRQEYVDSFQKDPDTRMLVLSIKAAGVGLTLTEASHIAFIELGWTPADMDQAEDRGHRIGLKHALNVWYLLAADTVDEDIWNVLEAKRKVVNQATDGIQKEAVDSVVSAIKGRFKRPRKRQPAKK